METYLRVSLVKSCGIKGKKKKKEKKQRNEWDQRSVWIERNSSVRRTCIAERVLAHASFPTSSSFAL